MPATGTDTVENAETAEETKTDENLTDENAEQFIRGWGVAMYRGCDGPSFCIGGEF